MRFTCEEEDGPRNDPLPNVVTDLEIRSEQILGLWINVVVLVRHVWDRRLQNVVGQEATNHNGLFLREIQRIFR